MCQLTVQSGNKIQSTFKGGDSDSVTVPHSAHIYSYALSSKTSTIIWVQTLGLKGTTGCCNKFRVFLQLYGNELQFGMYLPLQILLLYVGGHKLNVHVKN